MSAIAKVFIITKAGNPQAHALGREVAEWLAGRGVGCSLQDYDEEGAFALAQQAGEVDLLFVLGGDGTMLGMARAAAGRRVPLLGMNLGRLGFLSETTAEDWRPFLERLLAGGFRTAQRMVLEFSVQRGGQPAHGGRVINDLVLNRGALARLITVGVALDGEFLTRVRADGVIVSTPTGSTAYAMSAGGPVMHHTLDTLCVTAICPFLQHIRPLVLPGSTVVSLTVEEASTRVFLTLDGQAGFSLECGDEVRIFRSEASLLLVRPDRPNFVAKLRGKGIV